MAKGASIKFKSYPETVPKLLTLLSLGKELKKYDKIVIKPYAKSPEQAVSKEILEQVLKFCLYHKNPIAEVFIADGSDGYNTLDLFEVLGYKGLAEKYFVSLLDLNNAGTESISSSSFIKFESIDYPKVLLESFIISLAPAQEDEETVLSGSLASMLGVFPASEYRGIFSKNKSRIRKWPISYSIHDVCLCKLPEFAVIDASDKGILLAGQPLETDKQAAKILGKDWRSLHHLSYISETLKTIELEKIKRAEISETEQNMLSQ